MATKTKKSKKSKTAEVVDVVTPPSPAQPIKITPVVRKRLLPHNVAHEIALLQERVAELERKLSTILSDK